MRLQEKDPEVGERQELLFVCEDVQVEQLRQQEFPLRVVVLKLHFKDCAVVLL